MTYFIWILLYGLSMFVNILSPSLLPYRLKNLVQNTYRIDQTLSAQFIYMYKMERRYMHVT